MNRRYSSVAAIAGLLSLLIFAVGLFCSREPALEFTATDVSADWLTYVNEQNGFHIKYPSDDWSIDQFESIVTFSHEASGLSLSVRRYPTSVDVVIDQFQHDPAIRGKISVVKLSGLEVKRLQSIGGNFEGHWRNDDLFVSGQSGTYEINASSGFTHQKEKLRKSALLNPVIQEMIGTFGINEIEQSDYVTYTDPRYHFSFNYPSDWSLTCYTDRHSVGILSPSYHTVVLRSLKSKSDFHIKFQVKPKRTISEDMERFRGYTAPTLGEKREYFAHKILGQKYEFKDIEGYYFEKNGDLYNINIYRLPESRKPIDDVLDSLEL